MIAGKIIRGNTAIIQIFVDNKTECQRKKYLRAHIKKKEGRRKIKETLKKTGEIIPSKIYFGRIEQSWLYYRAPQKMTKN